MTKGPLLAVAMAAVFVVTPLAVGDFWLSVLIYAGILAVGALGLSLLTGYTGQISVGHAFFLGIGAYVAAYFGAERDLPLLVWLPLAAVAGGLAGAAVGPFAARLSGMYLAMVTVGLVFFGLHVWSNFESVTGGAAGVGGVAPAGVGPLDFNGLRLAGQSYSRNQSWFWLVWILVAVASLLSHNVVRSRAGRAMQAVRDSDISGAVIGIDVTRTKVGAFALSSAMAAAAGALYFGFVQYVSPEEWGLLLSIQFVAILIVGGINAWWGAVVGALLLGGAPRVVELLSSRLPALSSIGLSTAQLNQLLLGVLIIVFLMFAPEGVAGVWERGRATWAIRGSERGGQGIAVAVGASENGSERAGT